MSLHLLQLLQFNYIVSKQNINWQDVCNYIYSISCNTQMFQYNITNRTRITTYKLQCILKITMTLLNIFFFFLLLILLLRLL